MKSYGKHEVLGTPIDAIDLEAAVELIAAAARARQPCAISALAVHGVVEASKDPALRDALSNLDLVLPDGQPVRWAVNRLHQLDLPDKVPGPTVVEHLLEIAADEQLPVYFYGSTPATLERIHANLGERFGARLQVISTPSLFRPASSEEIDAIAARINESGAQLCFVGLGCPRQERFVAAIAPRLEMPSLAVGAAFDYLAGNIDRAPSWMQRAGLEWLFRLGQDPRRLARRYVTTNTTFVIELARQLVVGRARDHAVLGPLAAVARGPELVDA